MLRMLIRETSNIVGLDEVVAGCVVYVQLSCILVHSVSQPEVQEIPVLNISLIWVHAFFLGIYDIVCDRLALSRFLSLISYPPKYTHSNFLEPLKTNKVLTSVYFFM